MNSVFGRRARGWRVSREGLAGSHLGAAGARWLGLGLGLADKAVEGERTGYKLRREE